MSLKSIMREGLKSAGIKKGDWAGDEAVQNVLAQSPRTKPGSIRRLRP
jgi:hypothetical protein